jgi:hypothetical protein
MAYPNGAALGVAKKGSKSGLKDDEEVNLPHDEKYFLLW